MKRAPRSRQRHDLYAKYHDYDSEISDLLGDCGVSTFADFELHWTIQPEGDGCILRLEHRGFDLENPQHRFAYENMPNGWRSLVLPRLAQGLEAAAA